MAVTIDSLELDIQAKNTSATSALERLQTQLSGFSRLTTKGTSGLSKLRSELSGFGGSVLSVTAKVTASLFAVRRASQWIKSAISESNEYVETLNLFRVSLGECADEALSYARKVNSLTGIDMAEWMESQGTLHAIARGFGVASDRAAIMSKNLTQLGYDLSSLFNSNVSTAMEKIKSGLTGQMRPLREYGYDLSVARLQEIALANGITTRVAQMNQAQKAELRYIAMLSQVRFAQGDLAETIATPANALRILQQQFTQLSRAIGNIFLPVLARVVPIMQAITQAITQAAQRLANLFGYELPDAVRTNVGDVTVGAFDDTTGAINNATGAAKKLKRQLAGFDEINLLQQTETGGGGSGGGSGITGGGLGLALPEYDFLRGLRSQTDEIVAAIRGFWEDWSPSVLAFLSGIAGYAITSKVLRLISSLRGLSRGGRIALGITSCAAGFIGIQESIKNIVTGVGDVGANIGQALLWFGQMELVMFSLFGWRGALVGLGVAGVASLVGILRGMNEIRLTKIQREFESAYGNISLTLSEAKTLAKYLLTNKFTADINIAMGAFDNADSRIATIQSSLDEISKQLWTFSITPTVTSGDKESVLGNVKTAVDEITGWIKDTGYGITVALRTASSMDLRGYGTATSNFYKFGYNLTVPLTSGDIIDTAGIAGAVAGFSTAAFNLVLPLMTDTSVDKTGIYSAMSEYNAAKESLLLLLESDSTLDRTGLDAALTTYTAAQDSLILTLKTNDSIDMTGLDAAIAAYGIAPKAIDVAAHLKFIDTVESVVASNAAYVQSIGDALSAYVSGAFADGYFSFDEYSAAAQLKAKLDKVEQIIAAAEANAGFQAITMKWSGANLTMESATQLMTELQEQSAALKEAAQSVLTETLSGLHSQIGIAELKIADTDDPVFKAQYQAELDELRAGLQSAMDVANFAYSEQITKIDLQMSEAALQTATDALSGVIGKYASENIDFVLNAANWTFGMTDITPAELTAFQQHSGALYGAFEQYFNASFLNLPSAVQENINALVTAGATAATADMQKLEALRSAGEAIPAELIDRINTFESMAALKGEADAFLFTVGRSMTTSSAFYDTLNTVGYGAKTIGGAFGDGFLNNINLFQDELSQWFVGFKDGTVSELDTTNGVIMGNLEAMGLDLKNLTFEVPGVERLAASVQERLGETNIANAIDTTGVAERFAEVKQGAKDAKKPVEALGTEVQTVAESVTALGDTTVSPTINVIDNASAKIQSLITDLGKLKGTFTSTLKVKATVTRQAGEIANVLATILKDGNRSMSNAFANLYNYSLAAKGGVVNKGTMFLAGEQGPEIVGMVGKNSGVANQEQIADIISRQMANQSGAANEDAIAKAVARAISGMELRVDNESFGRVAVKSINKYQRRTGRVEIQMGGY